MVPEKPVSYATVKASIFISLAGQQNKKPEDMAVPEDDLHCSVEGDVFRWDFMRGRGGWHLATLFPEAGTARRVGRCHLSSARAGA